jgi:hypothetical protein
MVVALSCSLGPETTETCPCDGLPARNALLKARDHPDGADSVTGCQTPGCEAYSNRPKIQVRDVNSPLRCAINLEKFRRGAVPHRTLRQQLSQGRGRR